VKWILGSPRLREVALGVTALALVAGCGGSQVDHERVVAAGNGGGQTVGGAAAIDNGAPVTGNAAGAPVVPAPVTSGASGAVAGAPPAGGAIAPGTGEVPKARASSAAGATGKAGGAGAGTGAGTSGTTAVAACAKALSPIRLGQVTTTSGLVGSSLGGMRIGLQVWASYVNSLGGVQCHPIELTSLDDGSDSSRVAANWNQLMKVKGAVACVACGNPIPIGALRSAAERDKIAVVGGDLTSMDWYRSPYLFPQGGGGFASYDGSFIEAARVAKTGAVGLLYCVEASVCTDIKNNFPASVARSGLAAGPVKAISITQPDYTAECKTMKDANVRVIFMAADGAGIARMARSCASIAYQPILASGSIGTPGSAGNDPTLQRNELYLGTPVAPYLSTDVPGVTEWQNAMKRFAPNQALEQSMLLAWGAGKLFEAALAKVADQARAGDVTKDLVLKGLWQIKNEKLGGISPGVSFNQDKPATYVDCYYTLKITKGGWNAPRGSAAACFKPGSNTPIKNGTTGATSASAPDLQAVTAPAINAGARDLRKRRARTAG
jgi:branched-chain amino acid transport system substrate-binding protein